MFAQRVGVSSELLRAWERRYGLLQPLRSAGGYRLYGDADAERVARMRGALASGLSAAEAARSAFEPIGVSEGLHVAAVDRLLQAIHGYDESAMHAVLDESLAAFAMEVVLRELVLPVLTQVGSDWDQDALSVSQEHFASNVIRGRLLSLARLWGRGSGPLALLACAPCEEHDISLIAFGLVLRSHGWRILFLGANTPMPTLAETAESTEPAIVVVTGFDPALLVGQAAALRSLGSRFSVLLSCRARRRTLPQGSGSAASTETSWQPRRRWPVRPSSSWWRWSSRGSSRGAVPAA